ncbi:hypothetical protein [Spirosoma sordidisoli]|uniref:Uncharacterized protein n=1 Tax=Spirosoma sordidisoli TaxID=2502893 RepID=A0A4Q2UBL3_9BACT|nr:hypothetical protein [Spirosoma sordidisoli]RYC66327.1 hypothetical protein EQG79_30090 [Spirosoma sordidisoli]
MKTRVKKVISKFTRLRNLLYKAEEKGFKTALRMMRSHVAERMFVEIDEPLDAREQFTAREAYLSMLNQLDQFEKLA